MLDMAKFFRFQAGLVVIATLIPLSTFADDKDVIEYRQHVMSTLDHQTEQVGMILSSAIPDDNLAADLQIIALSAKTALKAFEPKVEGGQAKPEVWTNWADFSKRMTEFAQKTEALAKATKEQGRSAAEAGVVDALACKGCHDNYRDEKKK